MKNFKTIALGLLVGAMAIGFSSFTTANNRSVKINRDAKGRILNFTSTFYNLDGDPSNHATSNFLFRDGTTSAACGSAVSTKECKADWTTNNMPTNNQTPDGAGSPSYAGNGIESAQYNGQ
jgi:hypothetical protein